MILTLRPMFLIAILAGLSIASAGIAYAQPGAAATEANRRIVAAAFDRWAAGGTNFFNEVLADDVVWRIEGSGPSAGEFRGREAFIQRAVRPFAVRLSTPVRPTAMKVWADGDHVIANWEGRGIACDGRAYENSYAWIFRMRGGKVIEATAFLDLTPYDSVLQRIPVGKACG